MELNERLVGPEGNLGDVEGDGLGRSGSGDCSLGGDDCLLLVGLGLELVVVLAALDEGLAGVGDSHVLDSHGQVLVQVSASDLLLHVDAHCSLVHREDSACVTH